MVYMMALHKQIIFNIIVELPRKMIKVGVFVLKLKQNDTFSDIFISSDSK
jgi:hypothetical protein